MGRLTESAVEFWGALEGVCCASCIHLDTCVQDVAVVGPKMISEPLPATPKGNEGLPICEFFRFLSLCFFHGNFANVAMKHLTWREDVSRDSSTTSRAETCRCVTGPTGGWSGPML